MTDQPTLWSYIPPSPLGSTFSKERDGERLNAQGKRVYAVMSDGKEHTLSEISAATGDPEASVSARLRDIRRSGLTVDKRNVGGGTWMYRMIVNGA